MDFALSQLITDTNDPRSVLHGHSLARDMYGNDAFRNGYLTYNPATNGTLQLQANPLTGALLIAPVVINGVTYYDVLTNIPIPANSPLLYGYNFTRWIVRMSYIGPTPTTSTTTYPQAVSQSLEVIVNDFAPAGAGTTYGGQGFHAFRLSPIDSPLTLVDDDGQYL